MVRGFPEVPSRADASRQVVLQGSQSTPREAHHSLAVALADHYGLAFLPIQVAAAQPAGFMDAQPGVRQGEQESTDRAGYAAGQVHLRSLLMQD